MTSAADDGSVVTAVPPGLNGVVAALTAEFAGVFAPETVVQCVVDSRERLGEARVHAFLPVLTHRFARERLRAVGLATGRLPRTRPSVLFVCTHNADRSQLAAALLTAVAGERVEVRSAGTVPAAAVDPGMRATLREVGIDPVDLYPKPLTDESVQAADVVVTMGRGDACPVLPGRRYVDWDIPDPAGADPSALRAIREDIHARVKTLFAELPPGTDVGAPA